jgi:hypothetical protein
MELQLDYWLIPGKASETAVVSKSGKGDTTKSTLKTTFRSLQIQRLPFAGEHPTQHFLMSYSTKEKKQKSKNSHSGGAYMLTTLASLTLAKLRLHEGT